MILADVSIRRPVFATMVMLALIVFGLFSFRDLGVDLMPDVDFPFVSVLTILPGADPETIETKVTDVIEEAVNTISGIKVLTSISAENVSQVFIEFELGVDVDVAAQDVRDKISSIMRDLPDDVEPPVVEKFDINALPIMNIAVSANMPIQGLTKYVDDNIKSQLQKIPGIGSVKIIGGQERQIRVWADNDRMKAHGVVFRDIMYALQTQNIEFPGGTIESGIRELVVNTKGEVQSIEELKEIIVKQGKGGVIKMRDVATVEDSLEELNTISRYNGIRAVSLEIKKKSGANTVAVARRVKQELEKIRKTLPAEMDMLIAVDMSTFIEESIGDVQFHLIIGGLLAVVVIFFFLRNIRSTIISAIAIPTSIISTFTLMNYLDFTFNNVTMLALSLSVGLLIDDAIVVLENIFRHIESGSNRRQAAHDATSEIGLAVLATTLSIVAVFMPVAFMKGIIGRIFFQFGLTVTFAVLVSLFVSFTLTPMLCSRYLYVPKQPGWFYRFMERILKAIDSFYRRVLSAVLDHRLLTIIVTAVIFIFSLYLGSRLGFEFQPEEDRSEFSINIETPLGSSLEYTSTVIRRVEESMARVPGVEGIFTTIAGDVQESSNKGSIMVKLVEPKERSYSQGQIMEYARQQLKDFPNVNIGVTEVNYVGGGWRMYKIQFSIQGPELDKLQEYSQKIMEKLKQDGRFVDIDTTYKTGKPELSIYVDRDKAADLGVSVFDIASAVRVLVGGETATEYKEAGDRYDVVIRLKKNQRLSAEDLQQITLRNFDGNLVKLANVVRIDEETGPLSINHKSRQREVTILANLEGIVLGEAMEVVEKYAQELNMPATYDTSWTGEADIMVESFKHLITALFLAVILVYMILASQFESFLHPFTIMLSLPLSLVGAFIALLLAGYTISIFSFIGIIMLMGLVTKNAILLVDFTNRLKGRGLATKEALLEAGPIRLRPILMTTLAMIFGMLPIALGFGHGAESRAPMAVCVVGGLITSTVLTLVLVPVVYSLLDQLFGKRKS